MQSWTPSPKLEKRIAEAADRARAEALADAVIEALNAKGGRRLEPTTEAELAEMDAAWGRPAPPALRRVLQRFAGTHIGSIQLLAANFARPVATLDPVFGTPPAGALPGMIIVGTEDWLGVKRLYFLDPENRLGRGPWALYYVTTRSSDKIEYAVFVDVSLAHHIERSLAGKKPYGSPKLLDSEGFPGDGKDWTPVEAWKPPPELVRNTAAATEPDRVAADSAAALTRLSALGWKQPAKPPKKEVATALKALGKPVPKVLSDLLPMFAGEELSIPSERGERAYVIFREVEDLVPLETLNDGTQFKGLFEVASDGGDDRYIVDPKNRLGRGPWAVYVVEDSGTRESAVLVGLTFAQWLLRIAEDGCTLREADRPIGELGLPPLKEE